MIFDFDVYKDEAMQYDTAKYAIDEKTRYDGYMEKVLGLAGETGEVIEKIKKMIRDKDGVFHATPEDLEELKKELGDVLWYITAIGYYNGIELGAIAAGNLSKLQKRQRENKIHGSGDSR